MSFLRTADEQPIPAAGWFFLFLYCFIMFALVATFTPIRMPLSERTVPACSYCAIVPEDGPPAFVRSCSGGCDERV